MCVCVCVCERAKVCVCVCVCEREGGRGGLSTAVLRLQIWLLLRDGVRLTSTALPPEVHGEHSQAALQRPGHCKYNIRHESHNKIQWRQNFVWSAFAFLCFVELPYNCENVFFCCFVVQQ